MVIGTITEWGAEGFGVHFCVSVMGQPQTEFVLEKGGLVVMRWDVQGIM